MFGGRGDPRGPWERPVPAASAARRDQARGAPLPAPGTHDMGRRVSGGDGAPHGTAGDAGRWGAGPRRDGGGHAAGRGHTCDEPTGIPTGRGAAARPRGCAGSIRCWWRPRMPTRLFPPCMMSNKGVVKLSQKIVRLCSEERTIRDFGLSRAPVTVDGWAWGIYPQRPGTRPEI